MQDNEQSPTCFGRALVVAVLTMLFVLQCSMEEDSLISQEEANARIAAAYLYKDAQCGTSHAVTIPILTRADQKEVETCALEILAVDCSVWGSSDNLPLSCLAILIRL